MELKSQISVLEKKAHENWVSARQAERRLEDAKQEAAQLRNRLTLRERTFNEEKGQNRKLIIIWKKKVKVNRSILIKCNGIFS